MESIDNETTAPMAGSALERGMGLLGRVALILLCGTVTLSVVSRALWRNVVADDILIVSELMLVVILAPLALVTAVREHIAVTIFTDKLKGSGQRALSILGHVVGICFVTFLATAFWQLLSGSWRTGEYYEGQLNIPHWIGHLFALCAVIVVVIRLVILIVVDIRDHA